MKKEFDADVVLIASADGVYEIMLNGRTLFSRKALNRFPDDGEIVALIQSL